MVDLWMSSRRDMREVIPPSREHKVEVLRTSGPAPISKPAVLAPPPIAPVQGKIADAVHSKVPAQPQTPGQESNVAKKAAPSPAVHAEPQASGARRKFDVLKTAIVVAQKMLPLMEGNVGQTVSNLLSLGAPSPASSRDMAVVEDRLTKLHVTHQALSERVSEQQEAMVQIADRIEQLKEANNRNTLEQQELLEDAQALRRKFVVAGSIVIGLLIVSVALNVIVLLKLAH